jgi:hypothetical protein
MKTIQVSALVSSLLWIACSSTPERTTGASLAGSVAGAGAGSFVPSAGTDSGGTPGAAGNGATAFGGAAGMTAAASAGAGGTLPGGEGGMSAAGAGSAGAPAAGGMNAGGAGPNDGPQVSPRGSMFCDETPLWLGEMRGLTNEWTDPEQMTCLFLDEQGRFGWNWSRGSTGAGDNPTYPNYPEIEFGINPWNEEGDDVSTTTLLPLQLKDIDSASMTLLVNTTTNNNSGWNLAFELWLADGDPTQGPTNATGEVMIFLGNEPNYYPQTPVGGQLNDGHNTYTLYESADDWGSWGIYRQWRIGDTDGVVDFNGTINIGAFLQHHLETEGWNPDFWVTRFEIGTETFQNSGGTTTFTNLSFEVNGQTRHALTQ